MNYGIKIECPFCKRETEMFHLEYPKVTEKDIEIAKANPETLVWTEMSPKQSSAMYRLMIHYIDKNLPSTIYTTISRIKSHNIGLFKEKCITSDKVFKIYNVLIVDHEKQNVRMTFRIGDEIHDFEK